MAMRSFIAGLRRKCGHSPPSQMLLLEETRLSRSLSSGPLRSEPLEESPSPVEDLKGRIFRLRLPKRSATTAIQKWVSEGNTITLSELRQISRELRKSQRYKHALEISEWMVTHQEFELSDSDYAVRIDLMTKVFGIDAAERYFEGLLPNVKTGETYTSLLHSYAAVKLTERAEKLFERIKELNLALSALTYNEMMTLYMSVGQLEKVSLVIEELKRQKVPPDLFTYNLWISACAATQDMDGVRRILDKMMHDSNSNEDWAAYMKLTNIYITAGNLGNLESNSLVEVEKKITQREWITYDFLIILYTGLKNKERIDNIWKSLRMTSQKMTSRNYICILSSYLMLGQLKEAGEVLEQWKQSAPTNFDLSACNRLLDAFVGAELVEEATLLRNLVEKNCNPIAVSDAILFICYVMDETILLIEDFFIQILTWMGAEDIFQMSGTDHALRLELTIKVHGVAEAEEYFENILNTNSKKAACFSLLHCYVKERATKKAEALMLKIQELGLAVNPHLFNEMMKLYMATRLFENVPSVIQQMKENKLPLNVLSYNLWMNACAQLSGVTSAEMVYKEMMNDKNVEVGWSSHCTLANIYIRSGLVDNAIVALRAAEQKLSTQKRLGYFFLITQYSALNNKEEVLRLWEASKSVAGKITCANYMCILLCLVKVGGIEEAEKVFRVWESQCVKYDIRVSNVLLGAYMRNGWMDKAESLHLHTLKKGGYPNYKTWEILMEGWLKSQEMDKAVEAMKKGFAMLKHCDWRPSPKIIMSISEYFERHGDFENAKKYVKVIRQLGLMSLPLYKSLLRMHIHAGRPPLDILKMMEKDKIDMDEEVYSLVECVSK